jgi:hypothetical protein
LEILNEKKLESQMKKIEIGLGIVTLFIILIKIAFNPPVGALMILGISMLSTIYYSFGFALLNNIGFRQIILKKSYEHTNAWTIILGIVAGITFSMLLTGILFKLSFWQGGNWMLIVGLTLTGLLLIVTSIFLSRTNPVFFRQFYLRAIIIGVFGMIIFAVPATTFIDLYYRRNPDFASLYKKVIANPGDQKLRKQLEDKREEMKANRNRANPN